MTGFAWAVVALCILVGFLAGLVTWLVWGLVTDHDTEHIDVDGDQARRDLDDYDRLTGAPW